MFRSAALPLSAMLIPLALLALPVPGGFSARAGADDDRRLRELAGTLDVREVRRLLAGGARPNAPDPDGRTAVHAAAANSAPETMEALLEGGGDPDRRDKDGNTPLHLASAAPPLLFSVPTMLLLLERGANPDTPNGEGRTALHLAAATHERPAAIEALLARGADANRKDRWGGTPLHAALGPNPGWPGWPGLAAPGAVGALLAGGADPRLADGEGLTALQRLVRGLPDRGETAAMLLAAGADPDRKDADGDAPLHAAIRRGGDGMVRIAKALLAGGADPCVRDARGYLPYRIARVGGAVRRALERARGDEFACGGNGRTAGSDRERAASPDPDRWRRIQSALADRGFDPGPVDGRPGPRTRSAVSAWQRSRGYAGTGRLTDAQAGELLAAGPAVRPFGRDWIAVRNQPCQLWNGGSMSGRTAVWRGACTGGKASGRGRAIWRGGAGPASYEGPMRAGKAHGYGIARLGDDRYEGEFRNGVRHGRGTMTSANGNRYEGGWRNDLMHGRRTVADKSGRRGSR